MSYVYLDSKYDEYFVDDTTYATIVSLVQANKQCTFDFRNRHSYTQDNPCVGRNICLEHLLSRQKHLVYAGCLGADDKDRRVYRFVDAKGFIYTSTEDYSEEAKQSLDETLSYYGFTPPGAIVSRGKSVGFYSYYATLYGDLHTASVIVLSYHHHGEKVKGLFLLYKNGQTKELHKRSDVYVRANALVEASKDGSGVYRINGHANSYRSESDVYEVISQLESALYDVTRKLQNGAKSTDNHTGEQDAEASMRQDSEA